MVLANPIHTAIYWQESLQHVASLYRGYIYDKPHPNKQLKPTPIKRPCAFYARWTLIVSMFCMRGDTWAKKVVWF
jgi:hypothetical protein